MGNSQYKMQWEYQEQDGCHPEGCVTGPRNMRVNEMSWGQRKMEVPFEGGKGPEGAVAPQVEWNVALSDWP